MNQENEKSNKKVRIKHKWKCSNILLFQFFLLTADNCLIEKPKQERNSVLGFYVN